MQFINLKNYLDHLVENENVPSVDCIVCKNHKEIFRYYTGYRDIEKSIKVDGSELYIIYSMTKMITVTCALQLMEHGKFKLSDRIDKWLPEFSKMKIACSELNQENAKKITTGASATEQGEEQYNGYAKTPITVEHLLTMGAGLDYATKDKVLTSAIQSGKKTTLELVRAMADKTLGFEPGTRFRYSLCHDVLGGLIEIWSGKTLNEYLQENLCKPLGLKNTFFGLPKDSERLSKMATRYEYDQNHKPRRLPLENGYILTEEYQSGGAGLVSTAEDYATFLDALACGGVAKTGNRILQAQTIELMKTNHMKGEQVNDFYALRRGYGYGFGVRTHVDPIKSKSLSPIGEFGWDGAAGAFSMVDVDNNLSLTYFQQIHGWDVGMQDRLRNALYLDLKNQ